MFDFDYYKAQYEKLLKHNQELQANVERLQKLADPEAEETIKQLKDDLSFIGHLVYLIKTHLEYSNPLRDRIISLLIDDIYEIINTED